MIVGACHTAFIALPGGHRLRQHPASGPDARHQHRRGGDRHRRPDRAAEDADDEPLHPVVAVVRDRRARAEGRVPAALRLAAGHPVGHQRRSHPAVPQRRPHPGHDLQHADRQPEQRGRRSRRSSCRTRGRRGRITLNPGLRFDYFNTSIPEQSVPAGRFVPARRVRRDPEHRDLEERLAPLRRRRTTCSATARPPSRAIWAPTCSRRAPGLPRPTTRWSSRPTSGRGPTRTAMTSRRRASWGRRATGRSAPGRIRIRRPASRARISGSTTWRSSTSSSAASACRSATTAATSTRSFWTQNLAAPLSAYTLTSVADPLNPGQTIPIYNLAPEAFGLVDLLDDNSTNNRQYYQGVDVTVNVRYKGADDQRRHVHRPHAVGHLRRAGSQQPAVLRSDDLRRAVPDAVPAVRQLRRSRTASAPARCSRASRARRGS